MLCLQSLPCRVKTRQAQASLSSIALCFSRVSEGSSSIIESSHLCNQARLRPVSSTSHPDSFKPDNIHLLTHHESTPTLLLRKLPSISARLTLAEIRHRLVGTPRLRLCVADRLVVTLRTLNTTTRHDCFLRRHRIIHVLLPQPLVLISLLLGSHFLRGHLCELVGCDCARQDACAESRVGFVLEVLEEAAYLVAVKLRNLVFGFG